MMFVTNKSLRLLQYQAVYVSFIQTGIACSFISLLNP